MREKDTALSARSHPLPEVTENTRVEFSFKPKGSCSWDLNPIIAGPVSLDDDSFSLLGRLSGAAASCRKLPRAARQTLSRRGYPPFETLGVVRGHKREEGKTAPSLCVSACLLPAFSESSSLLLLTAAPAERVSALSPSARGERERATACQRSKGKEGAVAWVARRRDHLAPLGALSVEVWKWKQTTCCCPSFSCCLTPGSLHHAGALGRPVPEPGDHKPLNLPFGLPIRPAANGDVWNPHLEIDKTAHLVVAAARKNAYPGFGRF